MSDDRLKPAGVRRLIRFAVYVHTAALLALPKDSLGLMRYRPEDVTGLLLIALFAVLAVSVALPIHRAFAVVVVLYTSYFLVPLFSRDFLDGQFQAVAFWGKECTYVVYGYFVWWGFRDAPDDFLNVAILLSVPNVLYGTYQLLTEPLGLYGVSPWGHADSPASSGMLYATYTMLAFMKYLSGTATIFHAALLFVAALALLGAGSKVALVGMFALYGWYLVQRIIEKHDVRSLSYISSFAAVSAVAVALAISAERLGYSWRGLGRYRGLLMPFQVIAERGIWWKVEWLTDPLALFFGAGYSAGRIGPEGAYSLGMSMDNQQLYYLITGGVFGLLLYAILLTAIYRALPAGTVGGKVLRALVVSYVVMGLGGEVLQLSVHGNVFWMLVGLCFAMTPAAPLAAPARPAPIRAPQWGLARA